MSNVRIVFDSPTNSYYAGTTVTGRVIVNFDKPKKARGLKVKITGEAKVSWVGTESYRKDDGQTEDRSVSYHAEEEYFSNKYYLLGGASGEIEIPAGENVYPFNTTLPPQLPTSFDGERGHVRYTVVATIDRPWKSDFEAKSHFTVITPVDLNYIAIAKEQVKQEISKYFCCCCCKSGPLTLVVCLPHKGYVPGQTVPVTVEVDNASNVQVDKMECKIFKTIKWTARIPRQDTKLDVVDLIKLQVEGVAGGGSKTTTHNLALPEMPYVNVDACSIIDITFALKVKAVVGGCHKNLELEVPLVLGTVPIYEGGPPPTMGATLPQNVVPQSNIGLPNQNFAPGGVPTPYQGGTAPYPAGYTPAYTGPAPFPNPGSEPNPYEGNRSMYPTLPGFAIPVTPADADVQPEASPSAPLLDTPSGPVGFKLT
ncbi:arrestin domain-containing protein 3-like [Cimex lectularius]|uniref:Arrestin C-terminal-like domain-containing protein n=1 Tax=Cimex lectularius TaxID=79782 RepID=A0A8I6RX90_CIMLE|nr:arrestin domain-containing protein 3-like [Cimex lectularius]